jgi:hypothetical protein
MIRYLAFDIGCIECGEGSGPIGVYYTRAEAQMAANEEEILQQEDWSGQHKFEVYEIEVPE